ncbi:MAG: 23S rRNA (adenine(2503)-C(2))-methyltransferase RlmN, partial [Candidatus Omnitrophica bacterium]|nr:23S rRNA (adenine(2503)-C(2))-methyltransferase RlmN [Candidatus Omnitrophota bacterium]
MPDAKRSIYDLTLPQWTAWMAAHGAPAYRAKQLFHALYQRGVSSLEEMTDWPKGLRQAVAAEFALGTLTPVESQQSSDGTRKWLSRLPDDQLVETVLIPTEWRHTVCVSTQVGCAYACAFCASGQA